MGTPEEETAPLTPGDAFRIALPNFEGPLDLLLHLIKEHKVDIFDIPVALIAQKYVEYIERMQQLDLDVAGEFLVMASTLAHIKSRLLLPRQEQPVEAPEVVEEQGDPRAELVRRLLEYQKYKEAAEMLGRQDILDRDCFTRKVPVEKVPIPEDEVGLVEISVYKLIEALDRVLKDAEPQYKHEVVREQVSLSEAIKEIAARLKEQPKLSFYSLFEGQRTKTRIVITFLAMLEMVKLKLIRVYQEGDLQDIVLSPKGDALQNLTAPEIVEDEYR
ncbi:MAG TPA: segregation/condensation protein A [Vulgatibacter sp.]